MVVVMLEDIHTLDMFYWSFKNLENNKFIIHK